MKKIYIFSCLGELQSEKDNNSVPKSLRFSLDRRRLQSIPPRRRRQVSVELSEISDSGKIQESLEQRRGKRLFVRFLKNPLAPLGFYAR